MSAGLAGQKAHTLTDRIGTLVFSRKQLEAVDGFLSEAWSGDWHTRIGPNMVSRLKAQGRWPEDKQSKHQVTFLLLLALRSYQSVRVQAVMVH